MEGGGNRERGGGKAKCKGGKAERRNTDLYRCSVGEKWGKKERERRKGVKETKEGEGKKDS